MRRWAKRRDAQFISWQVHIEQKSRWAAGEPPHPCRVSFSLKKQNKKTTAPLLGEVIPPERGQLYCWKYWLCWATGKISEQRHVSHGAGVLKVSAPDDHHAAQYPRTSRLIPRHPRLLSTTKKSAPLFLFFLREFERGACAKFHLCQTERHRDALCTHAACKFGLKRTAGSLCAPGSDRLGEAPCRSVCC